MNSLNFNKINQVLNATLLRRLLVRYFVDKGYGESFEVSVYPPAIQDLSDSIPEIGRSIEVVPHAVHIDPQTGSGRVGWNLFVNGNQRLFLGVTEHGDMNDVAKMLQSDGLVPAMTDDASASDTTTPKRIVNFIVRILSKSKYGIDRQPPKNVNPIGPNSGSSPITGREMFNHNRPARGEV